MLLRNGSRLRAFRLARGLSLRETARQLHVKHPALREWEEESQVPAPPYREAIEIWTRGEIRASDWPLSAREREMREAAGRVRPVESSTNLVTEHEAAS